MEAMKKEYVKPEIAVLSTTDTKDPNKGEAGNEGQPNLMARLSGMAAS
jgi:hypothetical protein